MNSTHLFSVCLKTLSISPDYSFTSLNKSLRSFAWHSPGSDCVSSTSGELNSSVFRLLRDLSISSDHSFTSLNESLRSFAWHSPGSVFRLLRDLVDFSFYQFKQIFTFFCLAQSRFRLCVLNSIQLFSVCLETLSISSDHSFTSLNESLRSFAWHCPGSDCVSSTSGELNSSVFRLLRDLVDLF